MACHRQPQSASEPRRDGRSELGRAGEDVAERLLCRRGLRILERRYRRRWGEIDLVAEHGEVLVFVEVKSRSGRGYGRPSAAVTPLKRQRMARAALAYLARRGWLERPCRFDVVEVLFADGRPPRACHVRDAFRLWPTG